MSSTKLEKIKNHFINNAVIFGCREVEGKMVWTIDAREALQRSGFLADVGELMWDSIKKYNPEIIYGRGMGALNLLVAIQIAAEKQGSNILTLVSRDARKPRNRRRLIEGPRPHKDNMRAVYIDDVMNSGSTFSNTQKAFKEENIKINTVACAVLFDIWGFKGSRRLDLLGIPVEKLFTRHDIGMTRIDPVDKPVVVKEVWRNLAYNQWPRWYKNPPIIHDDMVYWANDRHELFAQKLETGEIVWQWQGPLPTQAKGIVGEMVIYQDRIYVSSYDGSLYCFNRHTGDLLLNHKLDLYLHSTPAICKEKQELYIGTEGGTDNKRGDIVALDLMSGQLKWRVPTEHVVPASPFIYKNQVLCGSNDGYLYSITDGVLNWKVKLGVIKGRLNSLDSVLIASTEEGLLYGLDEHGNILWKKYTGWEARHQFVEVHKELGLAYIVNQDGFALAFNKLGALQWTRQLRGACAWNMRLRGDQILVVTETGYVAILDAATGEKKQVSNINTYVTCPADFDQNYVVVHTVKKGLITYKRAI